MAETKRVLVLDNRRKYDQKIKDVVEEAASDLKGDYQVEMIDTDKLAEMYDENREKGKKYVQQFHRVISSGSSKGRKKDVEVHAMIAEDLKESDGKAMGICYGLQMFGRAYGAKVTNSGKMHRGYRTSKLTEEGAEHDVFDGVHKEGNGKLEKKVKEIEGYSHHQKYIKLGDEGDSIKVLATTESKTGDEFVEVAQIDDHIIGTQYHPEKDPKKGYKLIGNFLES